MMSTPRVLNDGTALSINNGAMPAWNKQFSPLPQRNSRRTSEALLVDRSDATRRVLHRDTAFLSRLVAASREGILECVPTEPRESLYICARGKDPPRGVCPPRIVSRACHVFGSADDAAMSG